MITKWPKHRTAINRTVNLAFKHPYINRFLEKGLQESKGTVSILEDIIVHQNKLLIQAVERIKELEE